MTRSLVSFSAQDVKAVANGRWLDILPAVGGIPVDLLDGRKEHPCPKCGGDTRFRLVDEAAGAVHCSHCFSDKCGDGFAAVAWANNLDPRADFPRVVSMVADYLGMRNGNGKPADPLEQMARMKRCPKESLEAYHARTKNGEVWVPMYRGQVVDDAGKPNPCGWQHHGPNDGFKGRTTKGSKHGVFLPGGLPDGGLWLTVEGVKDAAALHGLGFDVAGHPGDRLPKECEVMFRGCDVVIVPDLDGPSQQGAENTAARLWKIASRIRIARLPGEIKDTEGEDVRDVLRKPDGEGLVREAIANAAEWEPAKVNRADALRNWYEDETEDDKGDPKTIRVPLSMRAIIEQLKEETDGWPRRVGNCLFVHDDHGIGWFGTPAELFGWLQTKIGAVSWRTGPDFVKQGELYAELARTSEQYESIEDVPHEPPLPGHYYASQATEAGDGSKLAELLSRFCPATDADHDLLKTAFLTPGWGGPHGARPCYVITSDDGRGAGKTTIVKTIAAVWGGLLSFSDKEDVNKIKTRLLSADALARRVALLDNVKSHRFSWADLEGMITASTIGGHRMYAGEATRPNTLTWFVTLNGASLSTDMAQRAIIVKIRRPERSARWEDETREFVESHRMVIIGDIIGELQRRGEHLTTFSRWATWERDVLNCTAEPAEAQAVLAERQAAVDVEADEASTIEEHFADRLGRLHYSIENDRVFIPSAIATRWFSDATNENKSTVAVSRIIGQYVDEGRLPNLSRNTGRALGRGWIWIGQTWNCEDSTRTDLEERHERQRRE